MTRRFGGLRAFDVTIQFPEQSDVRTLKDTQAATRATTTVKRDDEQQKAAA